MNLRGLRDLACAALDFVSDVDSAHRSLDHANARARDTAIRRLEQLYPRIEGPFRELGNFLSLSTKELRAGRVRADQKQAIRDAIKLSAALHRFILYTRQVVKDFSEVGPGSIFEGTLSRSTELKVGVDEAALLVLVSVAEHV